MKDKRDIFIERCVNELGNYFYLTLSSNISNELPNVRIFDLTYKAKVAGKKTVCINDNNYRIERNDLDFYDFDPLRDSCDYITRRFFQKGLSVSFIGINPIRSGLLRKIKANVRSLES